MTYKMNRQEAFELIDAYLDGTLASNVRAQFEAIALSDKSLAQAVQETRMLNRLLAEQEWIAPSDEFTRSVMSKVAVEPAYESETAMEAACNATSDLLIEKLLQEQTWMNPSANFTHNVMQRINLEAKQESELAPVSRREVFLDWMQGLAPAAAIIAFVIMFGKNMIASLMGYLQTSAAFLDAAVGTKIFEAQPLIQLGVIVPLLGVLLIPAVITRRLRLSS